MASCTPRIILTLAVPIFGLLTVLFLKRKKLKSSDLKNLTDTLKPNAMKLQPDYSTVAQSAKTEETQLQENEESPTYNGVSNLPRQIIDENGLSPSANGISSAANGISSAANGISSAANGVNEVAQQNQTNGQCRASYAAALKINKNVNGTSSSVKTKPIENGTSSSVKTKPIENGTSSSVKTKPIENGTGVNVHTAKADNKYNQNGLKQSARTEQAANGESSTNGVYECSSSVTVNKPNGVSVATTSNQISKSKCKKKSRGKMPEKNYTCSIAPTSNGCMKDKNVLVKTDNEHSLSNGFSNLTIDDTSTQETIHVTKSQAMDLNAYSSNSTIEHNTSPVTDTQTIVADPSQISNSENVIIAENVTIKAAKVCDIVGATAAENHCISPESGRSSDSEAVETLQVDVDGHLRFSDDCVAAGGQDMLASPEAAYCDSLGSNDSGTCGSELQFSFDSQPCSMTYEFDLHANHCGYLIGKKGSHVNYIKEETNALIWIRNSISQFNSDKKIVSIIAGDEASIEAALKLIRKRFPVSHYPEVTLERSTQVYFCPPTLKLSVPESVLFQVVLSATVNAAHFFVHLPTHPSYHALHPFTMSMTSMYSSCHAPTVAAPTVGNIVVAPVNNGWFRAEVMEVFTEDDTCKLKYLDYGGFQIVPTTVLRQINFEFMQMPFQAIECYLANVTCHEELGWTEESKVEFENLAQGQILSAYVAGIADDGVPFLHLYKVTGATNTFINQALVESGCAKWVNYEQ